MVVRENPSRSAVSEILRPVRLAPATIARSESLKSPFFPVLMLGLNFSKPSSPHLDPKCTELLPNKFAGECICIYSMYIYHSCFFSIVILFLHSILIQFFILFTFTHAINIKLILNALYFLIYLYLKLLKLVAKQLNLAKSHMCWLWNTVDFNYIHLFTIYIQILVILHTFIQSDLQMRTIEAIKTNKRATPCKCYYKSR